MPSAIAASSKKRIGVEVMVICAPTIVTESSHRKVVSDLYTAINSMTLSIAQLLLYTITIGES